MLKNGIDLSVIQSLKELSEPGSPDVAHMIIDLFLDSTPADLQLLREAIQKKDQPTISKISHRLKSSAGNLGAMQLAETCKELEKIGEGTRAIDDLPTYEKFLNEHFAEAASSLKHIRDAA